MPDTTPEVRTFCMRPDASGGCVWSPITEVGLGFPLQGGRSDPELMYRLGVAHRPWNRVGLGGLVTIAAVDELLVTLPVRGRIKLNSFVALDLAPELIITGGRDVHWTNGGTRSVAYGRTPGFAIDASLNFADWGAVFVRTTALSYGEIKRWETSDYINTVRSVYEPGRAFDTRAGLRAGSLSGRIRRRALAPAAVRLRREWWTRVSTCG